jgi:hypothetical protein
MNSSNLEQGPVTCSRERVNEPSNSMQGGEFLVQLSDYHLEKDAATRD